MHAGLNMHVCRNKATSLNAQISCLEIYPNGTVGANTAGVPRGTVDSKGVNYRVRGLVGIEPSTNSILLLGKRKSSCVVSAKGAVQEVGHRAVHIHCGRVIKGSTLGIIQRIQ